MLDKVIRQMETHTRDIILYWDKQIVVYADVAIFIRTRWCAMKQRYKEPKEKTQPMGMEVNV